MSSLFFGSLKNSLSQKVLQVMLLNGEVVHFCSPNQVEAYNSNADFPVLTWFKSGRRSWKGKLLYSRDASKAKDDYNFITINFAGLKKESEVKQVCKELKKVSNAVKYGVLVYIIPQVLPSDFIEFPERLQDWEIYKVRFSGNEEDAVKEHAKVLGYVY